MERLPRELVSYIVSATGSYQQIQCFVQSAWNRRIPKSTISYHRGSRKGRSKAALLENVSSADWDWLVGLFHTDGCKFKDQWRYACVFTLSMCEKDILRKLVRVLETAGLSPAVYRKKGTRALDIRTYNKSLFEALPSKTSQYQPTIPLAYVAGLFDGDGYIGHCDRSEKWIFSQAKYPHLAQQVHNIVSEFGPSTLRTTVRQEPWLPISRVSVLKEARRKLKRSEFAKYCIRYSASPPN